MTELPDGDVLFADEELIARSVGEARKVVGVFKTALEVVGDLEMSAAEGALLIAVDAAPVGGRSAASADVIMRVAGVALFMRHNDGVVGLRTRRGRPAGIAVPFLMSGAGAARGAGHVRYGGETLLLFVVEGDARPAGASVPEETTERYRVMVRSWADDIPEILLFGEGIEERPEGDAVPSDSARRKTAVDVVEVVDR